MAPRLTRDEIQEVQHLHRKCTIVLEFMVRHVHDAPAVRELQSLAQVAQRIGNIEGLRILSAELDRWVSEWPPEQQQEVAAALAEQGG